MIARVCWFVGLLVCWFGCVFARVLPAYVCVGGCACVSQRVRVCVCVCYIHYMHSCVQTNRHTSTITYLHTYHTYIHACIHTCIRTYRYGDIQIPTHTHVYVCMIMYVCTSTFPYVHIYIYVYVYVCVCDMMLHYIILYHIRRHYIMLC